MLPYELVCCHTNWFTAILFPSFFCNIRRIAPDSAARRLDFNRGLRRGRSPSADIIHGAGRADRNGVDRTDQTDAKLIVCNDGAHAILLNSRYTQRNASPAILEFLDYIRTNDDAADYSSILTQEAKDEVCGVRQDEKIGRQYMRIELELQKQHRLGLAEGLVEGESHGKTKKLIEQVCKKLSKGKSPKTIAEELEEDLSVIEAICRAAEPFAPDCDVDAIFEAIQPPSGDETHPRD